MTNLAFPKFEHPRASIVILAWAQLDLLLACLQSLAHTLDGTLPYEVIVVSNDARPAIVDALRRQVVGIRFVEADVNLGFSGGNNLGASIARGEYLVFLNDDAIVAPGWLSWLLTTADRHADAGAVGSLILFPDGTIQEAGSIIWSDGSTMPVGRESAGDAPTWHFVRRVDYCSACSLLVRKDAWLRLGGFDPAYHPAYYEDVDLCLGLRRLGLHVLLEPRSRVWHHESRSSNQTFKSYLFRRNHARLARKWADELTFQEPPDPRSPGAVARAVWRAQGTPQRVLVVDDRVPDPGLGSGYGRMFTAVLELAAAGYSVSVFPTFGHIGPLPDELVSAGISRITDLEAHLAQPWTSYDAAIVSRPHNFERAAPLLRARASSVVLVYDCEALFWRRLVRQAPLTEDSDRRSELIAAAAEMRTLEERIVVESDLAVTVSDEEAALLRAVPGACPIQPLLPSEPAVRLGPSNWHGRRGVGFVAGWMAGATSPNADGLRWFLREVLPRIVAAVPWVQVDVTGANPPEDLVSLSNPNLRFMGYVQDIEAFYAEHCVLIAPIRFGAGVKVKTVQALQHGVPVVSTTCGAEGIDFEMVDAIIIEDDPERFAFAVVDLLIDGAQWRARRDSIEKLVRHWSERDGSKSWRNVIERALAMRRNRRDQILVSG